MQKNLFLSPYSDVTGQLGQIQPLSSEMHMKLFPFIQKSSSFALFAQLVYVGHFGQVHSAFFASSIFICFEAGTFAHSLCNSSNLSMFSPFFPNWLISILWF